MRCMLPSLAVLLVACGGADTTEPAEPSSGAAVETTSGDEATEPARVARTIAEPPPTPAVSRESLSTGLQTLWSAIDATVAVEPPATTDDTSADGPLTQWVGQRVQGLSEAIRGSESVGESPAHDRAVAAALIGYGVEALVSDLVGASASEPEAFAGTTGPLAREALVYYAFCEQRLAALGDGSNWQSWRDYCQQRGQQMMDAYGLSAPSPE